MCAKIIVRFSGALLALALVSSPGWLSASQSSPAEAGAGREVLVLGTFHMASPGRDLHNAEPDDVLSERRQVEMQALVDVLARFRPTKIAVEANFGDERIQTRYEAYLAGDHELSRNETEQVGYRLARQLGHDAVYPMDADGEFPYMRLMKFATATGQEERLEAINAETAEEVEAFNAYLASHTLLETLLYMNADDYAARGVGAYFQLAEFSEPWDWAGPDLVADWFRRNMRMYGNITGLMEQPDDRVLVIVGAGHLGWLRFAFDGNPDIRLRSLQDLVR